MLIVFLATSFSAFAKLTCSKNGTTVIYTNGIRTSPEEASLAIKSLLYINNSGGVSVEALIDLKQVNDPLVAYNYQESLAKDVLETTVQLLPQSYMKALQVTNAYAAYSHFQRGNLIKSIPSDIINSIKAAQLQLISIFSQNFYNSPKYEQTINEGFSLYLSAFQSKEKIFAISHSQGSLFMNDFYKLFPESDSKESFMLDFKLLQFWTEKCLLTLDGLQMNKM